MASENRFVESVAGVLEAEVTLETPFRQTPGWSSLKAFGLLVLMENDWKAPITAARLGELSTVRDLYREAFLACVAETLKVDRAALSGATAYKSIPEWDSVNHLRLVQAAEKRFGTSYPIERVPFILRVEDFMDVI